MMILRRLTDFPSMIRRNPFDELDRVRREMDQLMTGLLGQRGIPTAAGVFPLTNVTEDADNFYVRAELPGVVAADLDVSVAGNTVTIQGERKIEDAPSAKYHRREREAGRFSRVLTLEGELDADKVSATCADGILTVELPKAPSAKPRQISVKSS